MRDALQTVPDFLKQAAGFQDGWPVVVTFYGGDGSRHLKRRPNTDGGGALPVIWDEALSHQVEERLLIELEEGRQLGFIAGVGGSKKSQITHVYGLRAEIDLPDSHALQRQVYAAVEARYGIRFTLLNTGGKSLHAWIASATAIPVDQYSETSKRWHARVKKAAQEAGLDLPEGALDVACHRPTQVMRLPGALHRKSRKVAEVIQWGTGPVALETLGLTWPEVKEWAKQTVVPRSVTERALARSCEGRQFLGLSGDARIDALVDLAGAVPVRIPGAGTYRTALTLVSALSRALGAETAAEVLHRARHLDKEGRSSLDGLRQWCGTFEPDPEGAANHLAWLAAWAEREFGWKRPTLQLQSVLKPTELVEPSPAAISEAPWTMGGAMVVCRTGTGKTQGACAYVDRLAENWVGAKREFSMVAITPRRTINSQLAPQLRAVNVSGQKSGKGDPFCHP